jgi:DNA polymerase IV
MGGRKIIHADMDAFYASVEQRDNPDLRGKPVIVAWKGKRSVVCAASYEARAFGVRSAMPAIRAERLCPVATFLAPDFTRYRAVSKSVREIFNRHTDLIEPPSERWRTLSQQKLAELDHLTDGIKAVRGVLNKIDDQVPMQYLRPMRQAHISEHEWRCSSSSSSAQHEQQTQEEDVPL